MARPNKPSSSKRTSFGKRSDAEKAFKGKGKNTRGEARTSFGKRAEAGESKRPFRKSTGPSFSRDEKPNRSFGSSAQGFEKKPFGRRDDTEKRPFEKREGGFDARKSYGDKKPFAKRSFDKPAGFKKDSGADRPFRGKRDEGDKKPYVKREGGSDARKSYSDKKPFAKRSFDKPDGFKKDFGSDAKPFERRERSFDARKNASEKKPFTKPQHETPEHYEKEFGDKKSTRSKRDERDSNEPRPIFNRADVVKKDRSASKESEFGRPFKKSFTKTRVGEAPTSTKRARDEAKVDDGLTRLNKYIANSGMGSRRDADGIIKMGLISVNGTAITEMGYKVKKGDVVRYEDKVLKAEKPVYILLNKPKGFITTTDDPQERNTVMNLVAGACKERIYPVGRLDRNTTGLLLLTNDGDLADKLTHPSYQAKKVYKVELDKPFAKNDLQKMIEGVRLEEGKAMVDEVEVISEDKKMVGVEIHIGWNRVVRRIFEALGYEVVKLDRSVYAGLDKKEIGRGEWRFLKPEEVIRLKHFK